ncbi:MAG: DUF721 domain-containing protein, partial [Coriobacteriia bacterium]
TSRQFDAEARYVMGERERPPTSLKQGLKKILSSLDKNGLLTTAGIIEVWDDVVGPEIAGHTFISGLKDGVLIVLVDSPVWSTELNAMAEQLRNKLSQELGQKTVKSLRFTVSRRVGLERAERAVRAQAERGYGGEKVEPTPLSSAELEAVQRSVAGIENESLREAALRATVSDLESKKGQEAHNVSQEPSDGL